MFTKVIPVTGDRIQADLLRNQCLWLKDGHGWLVIWRIQVVNDSWDLAVFFGTINMVI